MTEPKPPLVPLSEAAQKEFEYRRETDLHVWNRCKKCDAWYETAKQSHVFVEEFTCDCGEEMSFPVPAASIIKTPDQADFAILAAGGVLDTGMSARDAVEQARMWWDNKGRHLMKSEHKRQQQKVGGGDKGNGSAFANLDPDSDNFMPSGIIHGEPWDLLDRRERLTIVKTWHHQHVRSPQQL